MPGEGGGSNEVYKMSREVTVCRLRSIYSDDGARVYVGSILMLTSVCSGNWQIL